MSHTPERRAEERNECQISARIELAERVAFAAGPTDISTHGVRLRVADIAPQRFPVSSVANAVKITVAGGGR